MRVMPEQLPSDPLPEIQPRLLRKKYQWGIVAALLIVVVAGIAWAAWPKPAKAPVANTSTQKTVSKNPQTASTANVWKSTVSPAAIPLGDGKVSTTPQVGYVDSCTTNFKGGGARHAGSWINTTAATWDSQTKTAVEGSVTWPSASYTVTTSGSNRIITTNDLPGGLPTGIFPIRQTDPAYQYDTNPNHIGVQSLSYSLPLNPIAAGTPSCLGLGAIGVMDDGVLLYDALDAAGRDAVAHETQDSCDGHPDGQERYHYHDVSTCIQRTATGSSTLVGYALDGYGIYVERDAKGNLPTDADLDACHGRTSPVMWNGKLTTIYHYDATLEYPYTVGCYHGTPVAGVHGS